MQSAFSEFFEDINEALRDTVRQLGGNKKVGSMLWPELPLTQAEGRLRDCLNPDRREKLSPEQVVLLLVEARKAGVHGAMGFLSATAGYEQPRPVSLDEQEADLQSQILEQLQRQQKMLEQLQRVQSLRPVRSAA